MLGCEDGWVRGGWQPVLVVVVGPGSVTLSMSGTAMTPGGAPLALQFPPVTVAAS